MNRFFQVLKPYRDAIEWDIKIFGALNLILIEKKEIFKYICT